MRDPYVHAEKTSLPGFGHQAIRALITDALGVAPDLPKTVGTGCGVRRPLASTSTVPEEITCLACREWLRGECLFWADTAARALELSMAEARPGSPKFDSCVGSGGQAGDIWTRAIRARDGFHISIQGSLPDPAADWPRLTLDPREAESMAVIVGLLADATPDQHRELAAAIRQAAADITEGADPWPTA